MGWVQCIQNTPQYVWQIFGRSVSGNTDGILSSPRHFTFIAYIKTVSCRIRDLSWYWVTAAVPEDILQHTRPARSLEQGLIFKNASVTGRIMTRNPRFHLHFKFNLWNSFFWFSYFKMEMFLNINVFGFSGNSLIRWCSVLSVLYTKYHDCQQWYFGYWFTLWLRTRVKETWLAIS
jgi:hypothetical protein